MFMVLDTVLLLGAAVFAIFVFFAFLLMFVQARWPAVEERLQYFFNTKFGGLLLAIIGIWGAIGAAYAVAFY